MSASNLDPDTLEKVLQKVTESTQKILNKELKPSARNFLGFSIGLFEPLGKSRDEWSYTKTLSWFLDPEAEHGYGNDVAKQLWGLLIGSR